MSQIDLWLSRVFVVVMIAWMVHELLKRPAPAPVLVFPERATDGEASA